MKMSSEDLERLQNYSLINTDLNSAKSFSQIKYSLFTRGISISDFDLFIAGQTISNNLKLISMDKDFKNIPELKIIAEFSGIMIIAPK